MGEVARGTGAGIAQEEFLGHQTAEGDGDTGFDLGLGAGEPLFGVAVGQQTQRTAALDDREHLEPPVLAHEVRDGGVAGLVGRDGLAIGVGVHDRLLQCRSPR